LTESSDLAVIIYTMKHLSGRYGLIKNLCIHRQTFKNSYQL